MMARLTLFVADGSDFDALVPTKNLSVLGTTAANQFSHVQQ